MGGPALMDVHLLRWIEELYTAAGDPVQWALLPAPPAASSIGTTAAERHRALASNLHARLVAESARLEAFARVLDELPHAVVVVDAGLDVLIMQRRARVLVERGDVVRFDGSAIRAASRASDANLRSAVTMAIAQGTRVSVMLERFDGSGSVPVLVAAISRSATPPEFPRAAMIVISDPALGPVIDEPALRQLYGLTRAEAHLAALLLAGKSLEECADELFVSLSTVRTHLQRIFIKTDTTRQATLLRTLLLGPASLA